MTTDASRSKQTARVWNWNWNEFGIGIGIGRTLECVWNFWNFRNVFGISSGQQSEGRKLCTINRAYQCTHQTAHATVDLISWTQLTHPLPESSRFWFVCFGRASSRGAFHWRCPRICCRSKHIINAADIDAVAFVCAVFARFSPRLCCARDPGRVLRLHLSRMVRYVLRVPGPLSRQPWSAPKPPSCSTTRAQREAHRPRMDNNRGRGC